MGRNATRAQQAKARVREARLVLLAERRAQDERIEEATVRTVLAWEDVVAAQARLDAAERQVGDALAALGREKVPVAQMVTLTGIGRPQCARLLRRAVDQANAATPESEPADDRRLTRRTRQRRSLSQRSTVTWAGRSVADASR